MPGLGGAQRNDQLINNATSYFSLSSKNGSGCSSSNGFWSKHRDDINLNQLQKFWSELSPQARQDLLRIGKQTLFEQARKNMYCSRCNGLLLEGFVQIVMFGKSLQQEGVGGQLPSHSFGSSKDPMRSGSSSTAMCQDESQDPSVHPWGGLSTTRDGALTLLDCYLYSRSLQGLQNVFDSARARERERELLYPDACGGGGRGWISQGIASYGRGHGTRETCALHTARLACDTLVDFWSALGEETRQSLLRMKEEDFIERLMYRFDSKRFCRDCRRNVIREFKELKELKRMRREPRCTSWFCVADTAFQYEVSNDTVYADWHQTFVDSIGTYHHFEWAIGSGEGKSDIVEFENVGMNGSVQVNGLDLAGLNACYITLRAWKLDGRCTEFSVKAHALKGRQCIHCKLVVGDGFVTITHGENIRRFFEHAEEAEEEEDDDSMDKDGNDLDGECSRPQKHAKSPELAREFLLDAATVIFKEQVEKAFREGTARQNAHSIFVCLALKLLEERIHVACKEIITLEKQMKLLEEEEKEKREEEERKERRRTKEREKKIRRKERLRGKEKDKKCSELDESPLPLDVSDELSMSCIDDEAVNCVRDSVSETGDTNLSESASPGVLDELSSNNYATPDFMCLSFDGAIEELADVKEDGVPFVLDNLKGNRRKWADRRQCTENGHGAYKSESRYYEDPSEPLSKGVNCFSRQPKASATKFSVRNNGQRFGHKVQCSNLRAADRIDLHPCGCNQPNDYRTRVEPHSSAARFSRDTRSATKMETVPDMSRSVNRMNKFNQVDYMRDNCGRSRTKASNYSNAVSRDSPYTKKVWEPVEPQKRYPRSNSDSDVTLRSCSSKTEIVESERSLAETCSSQDREKLADDSQVDITSGVERSCQNGFQSKALYRSKEVAEENDNCNLNGVSDFSACSSSISDNCSSCLSEGDSNTPSSNRLNQESSSTSDSEDCSQLSEGTQSCDFAHNGSADGADAENEKVKSITAEEATDSIQSLGSVSKNFGNNISENSPVKSFTDSSENGNIASSVASVQGTLPSVHNPNISFPVFRGPSTVGYYHQNPIPWSTAPNGLIAYPHPNHYLLPSPFGYGLGGDSPFCMQYGPVQHLVSPFMNSGQIPVYQPLPRDNCMNTPEQTNVLKANGGRDLSSDRGRENVVPVANGLTEVLPEEGIEKGNLTKLDAGNAGFSLFQFGGPVALPTNGSGLQSSDEGKPAVFSCCHVEDDHACSKKDSTVEYNLFGKEWNTVFNLLV